MTSPSHASQRERPVITLNCTAELGLCHEIIQALSEAAPSHVIRLNPRTSPAQAFAVTLDLAADGGGRLRWQEDEEGRFVRQADLSDAEFARHLFKASPALVKALKETE